MEKQIAIKLINLGYNKAEITRLVFEFEPEVIGFIISTQVHRNDMPELEDVYDCIDYENCKRHYQAYLMNKDIHQIEDEFMKKKER